MSDLALQDEDQFSASVHDLAQLASQAAANRTQIESVANEQFAADQLDGEQHDNDEHPMNDDDQPGNEQLDDHGLNSFHPPSHHKQAEKSASEQAESQASDQSSRSNDPIVDGVHSNQSVNPSSNESISQSFGTNQTFGHSAFDVNVITGPPYNQLMDISTNNIVKSAYVQLYLPYFNTPVEMYSICPSSAPINQSMNQSIDHAINQSPVLFDWDTCLAKVSAAEALHLHDACLYVIDLSSDQSINQSSGEPVNQSNDQSVNRSVNPPSSDVDHSFITQALSSIIKQSNINPGVYRSTDKVGRFLAGSFFMTVVALECIKLFIKQALDLSFLTQVVNQSTNQSDSVNDLTQSKQTNKQANNQSINQTNKQSINQSNEMKRKSRYNLRKSTPRKKQKTNSSSDESSAEISNESSSGSEFSSDDELINQSIARSHEGDDKLTTRTMLRGKPHIWTKLEEDTLKEGMSRFGKQLFKWQLILDAYPDVFPKKEWRTQQLYTKWTKMPLRDISSPLSHESSNQLDGSSDKYLTLSEQVFTPYELESLYVLTKAHRKYNNIHWKEVGLAWERQYEKEKQESKPDRVFRRHMSLLQNKLESVHKAQKKKPGGVTQKVAVVFWTKKETDAFAEIMKDDPDICYRDFSVKWAALGFELIESERFRRKKRTLKTQAANQSFLLSSDLDE